MFRDDRKCSEMSLERFGFASAHSSATPITSSASATTVVTEPSISTAPTLVSQSSSSTAPPTKRRRFSSNWSEGREWLKCDERESGAVMFCEWCRRFKKSDLRNQFVSGCASMKLESVKSTSSPSHKRCSGSLPCASGTITNGSSSTEHGKGRASANEDAFQHGILSGKC